MPQISKCRANGCGPGRQSWSLCRANYHVKILLDRTDLETYKYFLQWEEQKGRCVTAGKNGCNASFSNVQDGTRAELDEFPDFRGKA